MAVVPLSGYYCPLLLHYVFIKNPVTITTTKHYTCYGQLTRTNNNYMYIYTYYKGVQIPNCEH